MSRPTSSPAGPRLSRISWRSVGGLRGGGKDLGPPWEPPQYLRIRKALSPVIRYQRKGLQQETPFVLPYFSHPSPSRVPVGAISLVFLSLLVAALLPHPVLFHPSWPPPTEVPSSVWSWTLLRSVTQQSPTQQDHMKKPS